MKYSKTMIAAAIATLAMGGTAIANDGDKMKSGASFDTLDTNRDGRISKAEAAADANIVFSTADANGDGYLDNSEFKKAHKAAKDGMPPAQPQSSPSTIPDSTSSPDSTPPESESTAPPVDAETPRQ